jgi:hypothetical protein
VPRVQNGSTVKRRQEHAGATHKERFDSQKKAKGRSAPSAAPHLCLHVCQRAALVLVKAGVLAGVQHACIGKRV